MNRNRMLIGLVVAVIIGLAVSTFVYRQIQQAQTPAQTVVMGKAVVASASLPLGTRLQEQFLRTIPWPGGEPVAGMFTKIEDCVGRALITTVVENELILEGKLAPEEGGAGLAPIIPEGMRGLSVRVDEVIGVAGFVLPSTMVDVLVTGSVGGRGGGGDAVTRTILENIRVLTSGQRIEEDREGKPQKVAVVTLLVTPEEAAKLTMASTEGRIQLALRNTIDTKKTEPAPVYRATLFGGAERVRRREPGVQPKATTYVVETIRGDKRETTTFPDQPSGAENQ
jgi:pilus assembly protein CpaB